MAEMLTATKALQDTVKPVSPAASPNRAYALDALRGFAILAMLLSGQLPYNEHALPAWMYHAQVPPPHFVWSNSVYGITWVDLVFPFFLFAMGGAFPLAFARRMDAGMPKWRLALFILERGFLLGFFALYVMAIRPYQLSKHPTVSTWLLGLFGFGLLFPILTRLPDKWPAKVRWGIKLAGWLGAILFLKFAQYPDGSGFSLERSDIIIVVLANMAVFGSLAWMLTRHHLLPRLGILGILLAIRLCNMPTPLEGWVSEIWKYSPVPWIYKLYYLQYLCIVIPGTIAGDLILQWTRQPAAPPDSKNLPAPRLIAVAVLMFVFVLELLIGLKSRWLVTTTLFTFALCGLGWWVLSKLENETERLYKNLFLWASYWLILGLFFEPYEGGIRKDKATVSYYFITSGLAICVFIGFSVVIDVFKRRRWFQLLIDNGQNPMIAYAGINNFIIPVLALTGIETLLTNWAITPWRGFCQGMIVTLLMALVVSLCTRFRIFWRT
jgi:predicted acyltransferase